MCARSVCSRSAAAKPPPPKLKGTSAHLAAGVGGAVEVHTQRRGGGLDALEKRVGRADGAEGAEPPLREGRELFCHGVATAAAAAQAAGHVPMGVVGEAQDLGWDGEVG
jgi:hypothetical protein